MWMKNSTISIQGNMYSVELRLVEFTAIFFEYVELVELTMT